MYINALLNEGPSLEPLTLSQDSPDEVRPYLRVEDTLSACFVESLQMSQEAMVICSWFQPMATRAS